MLIYVKKISVFIFLFLVSTQFVFSQNISRVAAEKVLEDVSFFSSLYPRLEGSVKEEKAIAHITDRFDNLNIKYSRNSLSSAKKGHSFSENINVRFEGEREDTLLILVPLNHPDSAAQAKDRSLSLALALAMAEELSLMRDPPAFSVEFVFLGGEFGNENRYPLGTKYFLDEYHPGYPVAALYLELLQFPKRIVVRSGDSGTVSPFWFIKRCSDSLGETDLFFLTLGNENQFHRLAFRKPESNIYYYLQKDIPTLGITGRYEGESSLTKADWTRNFLQFFVTFLEKNENGFGKPWDRHYLFFQVFTNYIIIDEPTYILLVLIGFALFYLYAHLFSYRFRIGMKALMRRIWNLPFLFLFLFIFLMLGTGVMNIILSLKNYPGFWKHAPVLFLAGKLGTAVLLFLIIYRPLHRLPFTSYPYFYSSAGIFTAIILFFAVSVVDISLGYYFLWALIIFLPLIRSKRTPIKYLLFFLSAAFIAKAFYDVFTLGKFQLMEVILTDTVIGNFVLALIIIPFMLIYLHIIQFSSFPVRVSSGFLRTVIGIMIFIALGGMFGYLFILQPFSRENPQPIKISEFAYSYSDTSELYLNSPAPIGNVILRYRDNRQIISGRTRNRNVSASFSEELLEIEKKSNSFLNRTHYKLIIEPMGNPHGLNLELQSNSDNFILFDANYPFTLDAPHRKAEIFIGYSPPYPLSIEFTVPSNIHVEAAITLEYRGDNIPYTLDLDGTRIDVERYVSYTKKVTVQDAPPAQAPSQEAPSQKEQESEA